MICNYQILIRTLDEFLVDLGTSGIIDGRKARDQLLDLRLMCERLEIETLQEVIL